MKIKENQKKTKLINSDEQGVPRGYSSTIKNHRTVLAWKRRITARLLCHRAVFLVRRADRFSVAKPTFVVDFWGISAQLVYPQASLIVLDLNLVGNASETRRKKDFVHRFPSLPNFSGFLA